VNDEYETWLEGQIKECRLPQECLDLLREKTHFILDAEHRPVPATLLEHAWWKDTHPKERIVGQKNVGGFSISTVFLGRDLAVTPPPELFETMVFNPAGEEVCCERWATWEEAAEQHRTIVAQVANFRWSRG
jgi:hypothetical protein